MARWISLTTGSADAPTPKKCRPAPAAKTALIALLLLCQSCFFCYSTGSAFFGKDIRDNPTYPYRRATGLFLAPFAIVLDIVTSPIQAILLVIMGDDAFDNVLLYVRAPDGLKYKPIFLPSDAAGRLVAIDALTRSIEECGIQPGTRLVSQTHF